MDIPSYRCKPRDIITAKDEKKSRALIPNYLDSSPPLLSASWFGGNYFRSCFSSWFDSRFQLAYAGSRRRSTCCQSCCGETLTVDQWILGEIDFLFCAPNPRWRGFYFTHGTFLPPAGNNTGRKTIRISRVAAVGTNSESKRYLKKKETHHSLVKEEKRQLKAPGPECGRVFKPHARFSRFMGRLAKIFDLNLRIDFLCQSQPRLRYRKNIAIE